MAKKQSQKPKPTQKPANKRPTGVTIICILSWIGALLWLVAGAALTFLGGAVAGLGASGLAVLGALAGVVGVVLIILAILLAVATYWLWQMKKTGWTIVIILAILGLLMSLGGLNIIGIVIYAIIVYYLYTNRSLFK